MPGTHRGRGKRSQADRPLPKTAVYWVHAGEAATQTILISMTGLNGAPAVVPVSLACPPEMSWTVVHARHSSRFRPHLPLPRWYELGHPEENSIAVRLRVVEEQSGCVEGVKFSTRRLRIRSPHFGPLNDGDALRRDDSDP